MINNKLQEKIRIQKYLSSKGVCSRREAERLIESKKIIVNGKIAVIGQAVSDADYIRINNKLIKKEERKLYFLLNKPKGYLSATKDKRGLEITSLVKTNSHIWPVGRLDVDTTGLIFLSNDGAFTDKVTKPSSNVKKTYIAKVNKPEFSKEEISKLFNGIKLDDGYITKKAHEVSIIKSNNKYSHIKITISEGKQNQIKRMFKSLNCEVVELTRISIGGFKIGLVPNRGEYIIINPRDINKFINTDYNK